MISCFPLKWFGTQKLNNVLEIMKARSFTTLLCECANSNLHKNVPLKRMLRCGLGLKQIKRHILYESSVLYAL